MADYVLIEGGRVLDIAGRRADPADILVEGDRIAALLPPGAAAPPDARRIDARDRLLMPGLINAHTHGHGHLGKGSGDTWTLELLLHHGPWLSGGRSAEDRELACLVGGLEMIRRGVTACYDLLFEPPIPTLEGLEAAASGYAKAGIRVVLAPMVADRSVYEAIPGLMDAIPEPHRNVVERYRAAPQETTRAQLQDILRRWRGDRDRIRLALAPTIPLHCSDELLLGCRDLAREFGVRLHMHVAESRVQAVSGPVRYGSSLTAHLAELDMLGPDFTAAHAIWLDDDDIARLADSGATVAHNPGSNLRLGAGIARSRDLLDRGVALGIGTDGSTCSDHQNMFEAARMAALVSRVRSPDPDHWVSSPQALEWATAGGARVLGFDGLLGRLEPGYKADIVFLDLADLTYMPLNDPVTQIVMAESGAAVHSVMVGGRFVYRDRRFPDIDLAQLRQRIEDRAAELRPGLAPSRDALTALERYVTSFCIGLAREPFSSEGK